MWDESGSKLHGGVLGARANVTLSADGHRIAVSDSSGVGVLDASSGESLWHFECERCFRISLSADGSRLLTGSDQGVAVWDVGQKSSVWSESSRMDKSLAYASGVSGDGQRVLWARGSSIFVHRVGERSDGELRLDSAPQNASLSYGGTRIAVVNLATISVWDVGRLRPIWQVRNLSSALAHEVCWSSDDSALMVLHEQMGTSLIDSETGERFANLTVTKPAALLAQEIVLPSLGYRISREDSAWEMWPLPVPDDRPPRASLMRVLSQAGLEMRGGGLVGAAPGPGAA